jgi:hypothetical protein
MSKFLNFMVRLSENTYASRKDSLESMYCLNEVAEGITRTAATRSIRPVQNYSLHHCAICDADHY